MLYLAEGDSETPESWSGCSRGLVQALRRQGATVATSDVLPGRLLRWAAMVAAFHPDRARWAARYHSAGPGFLMRSWSAVGAVRREPDGTLILQAGATFDLPGLEARRTFVYCDANAVFAARGAPYSSVAALTPRERAAVVARERRVYRRCTGIFTFSDVVRRSFIADFSVPEHRVTTVYAGSNLDEVPEESDVITPRDGPPTIVFVGKAFERKGGPDLVAAFRRVREQLPAARLRIAGATPAVARDSGVEVLGFVDPHRRGPGSLYDLYRQADLFCMPSRYEPFGVVFAEAMLHAVPCVGTRAWAMPEIINHGVTGWLAPPGDVRALADVLIEALRDRARLRRMGLAARRTALERFTWDRVAAAMLRVMVSPA